MVQAINLRDLGMSVLHCLEYFGEGDSYSGGRGLFSIIAKGQLLAYTQGHVALRERSKQYSVISEPTRCYGWVGIGIF